MQQVYNMLLISFSHNSFAICQSDKCFELYLLAFTKNTDLLQLFMTPFHWPVSQKSSHHVDHTVDLSKIEPGHGGGIQMTFSSDMLKDQGV